MYLNLLEENFEFYCRLTNGFKVQLHAPNEAPQMNTNYFRVPIDQHVLVSIKPNMIITSPRLRSLTPEYRQCYYGTERKLRFFQVYTQVNCELECLSNYTKERCGCVKFSVPSTDKYIRYTICS